MHEAFRIGLARRLDRTTAAPSRLETASGNRFDFVDEGNDGFRLTQIRGVVQDGIGRFRSDDHLDANVAGVEGIARPRPVMAPALDVPERVTRSSEAREIVFDPVVHFGGGNDGDQLGMGSRFHAFHPLRAACRSTRHAGAARRAQLIGGDETHRALRKRGGDAKRRRMEVGMERCVPPGVLRRGARSARGRVRHAARPERHRDGMVPA